MAPPWSTRAKSIDGIVHRTRPTRLNLSFSPPTPLQNIRFSPRQLYGSVARSQALPGASLNLVRSLTIHARDLIAELVDNTPRDFAFTNSVLLLADAKRTAFSGDIGAGITDRYMESLGYVWRDNARNLVPTGQIADFVYDGPPTSNGGVVLAEAKGSITSAVTPSTIAGIVSAGYQNQVEPHIGTAPHGATILHGYAVGIASRPGDPTSHVHVEEPATSLGGPSGGGPGSASPSGGASPGGPRTGGSGGDGKRAGSPNPRLALGNYRAVFALAEAESVVRVIDAIRVPGESSREKLPPQLFARIKAGSNSYLAGVDGHRNRWGEFAIDERVARAFLGQLKLDTPVEKQEFTLPILPSSVFEGEEAFFNAEVFPDGLAILGPYSWGEPYVIWDPNTGTFSQ